MDLRVSCEVARICSGLGFPEYSFRNLLRIVDATFVESCCPSMEKHKYTETFLRLEMASVSDLLINGQIFYPLKDAEYREKEQGP